MKSKVISNDFGTLKFNKINRLPNQEGLYLIYNKRSKLIYVGISNNIKKRLKQHKYGCSHKPLLTKQIYSIDYYLIDMPLAAMVEMMIINIINPFFNGLDPYNPYLIKKPLNKIIFPWEIPYFGDDLEARDTYLNKRAERIGKKREELWKRYNNENP